MRRLSLIAGVLLGAVLAWWLLGRWVIGESERVYLLVPPVFVAVFLVRKPDGWKTWKPHVRPVAGYVAGLAVFVTLYSFYMAWIATPLTWANAFRAISAREIFFAVYFFLAVTLLLSVLLGVFRRLIHRFGDRLFGATPPNPARQPGAPSVPRQVFMEMLLLSLIVPYILAVLHIHRFKVPNPTTPMEQVGRPYEDVQFQTADGLTIRGWFIPALQSPSSRTLIICHGVAANRSSFLPFLEVGDALQAHVLMFDFRGHGDSDGHTVTYGYREKLDVRAAVDYLRTDRPEQARQIIGLGISMGSSGLIGSAAELEPPFDAVIIDSGYTSAVELTDKVLAMFPAWARPCLSGPGVPLASLHAGCWLPEVRPVDQIHAVRAPVLLIHARGDELIPVEHGQRLYDAAVEPKELWIADTDGHSSAFRARPEYLRAVTCLVEAHVSSKEPRRNNMSK